MTDPHPSGASELQTRPLAVAIGICLAFLVVGQLLAPGDREGWFEGLTLPDTGVPMLVTLLVGVLYYPLFVTVLYRVLAHQEPGGRRTTAFLLTLVVMAMDWVWNLLFFGLQSPFAGALGMAASLLLMAALVKVLFPVDRTSALFLTLYLVWVGWEVARSWWIWRLNPG